MKKIILATICSLTLVSCGKSISVDSYLKDTTQFDNYGSVTFNELTSEEFLNKGFNYGDYVTVSFLDQKYVMPVVPDYNYIDNDVFGIVLNQFGSQYVAILSWNSFIEKVNLGIRNHGEWLLPDGLTLPIKFNFKMQSKGGYSKDLELRNITKSNNREDYKDLSDAEFANYREVKTTGLKENNIYRSSSPIDPSSARNEIVQQLMENDKIATVFNLSDTKEDAEKFEGYKGYYTSENVTVHYMGLGVDFTNPSFKEGIKNIILKINDSNAPLLFHCKEGKDRTGFIIALLEAISGATLTEIKDDYTKTYVNYYGLEKGSEKYTFYESKIIDNLNVAFNVDLNKDDSLNLKNLANQFFLDVGLTQNDIDTLINKICK